MDCSEIEAAILRGAPPDPSGLEEHLAGCASCRFLVDDGAPVAQALAGSAQASPPELDLAALAASTEKAVRGERGPLAWIRARPRPARMALVVVMMAVAIGVYLQTYHLRPDWSVYPALRLGLTLAGFAVLALLLTWEALRPIWLPPLDERVLIAAGIAAPILAALLPEVPTALALPRSFTYYATKCFLLGSAQALAVLVVARAVARGRPGAVVAAAGAGIAGILGLALHCPINAPGHLLAGHATVPAVLVLGYVLAGRWVRTKS